MCTGALGDRNQAPLAAWFYFLKGTTNLVYLNNRDILTY